MRITDVEDWPPKQKPVEPSGGGGNGGCGGIGCLFMAIAVAILVWTFSGFPAFWK
jgi:hypothetical protein